MLGEAGQGAVELVVVGAVVLHGAAGLVRDGHHAVDVGILLEQVGRAEALGDVLAGAGRAVDGADDGDVVAGAVAAVAAVVAHASSAARPGRAAAGSRGRRRSRARRRRRRHCGRGRGSPAGDVLAGEADDLAVLVDRLALLDRPQGDLVAQADARGRASSVSPSIWTSVPGGRWRAATATLSSGRRWTATWDSGTAGMTDPIADCGFPLADCRTHKTYES